MLSTLLKIGPLTIHAYGLMIAIGFLLALRLAQRDADKAGLDGRLIGNMAFIALLFGILGTRVLHIIMFPEGYSWRDPLGWIAIWNGGLVFQGAIPGALVYAVYGCRRHKLPFWRVVDISIPMVPLAHAFGRIGCFMNGCCYGKETSLPWGVCFPRVPWDLSKPVTGSPPYLDQLQRHSDLSSIRDHWSYPVHPTQLYGFVALLILCAVLLCLRNHWHPFDGFTMPVYLVLYGFGRFFGEFLRGDHNPTTFGLLSDQQVFSIVYIILGAALYIFLWQYTAARAKT